MKRLPITLFMGFTFGFLAALLTVSGCSKAATRTLTVFQHQSTETYTGAFHIDTSQLPPDAIKTQTETGEPGQPETRIELDMDYEIEIVLRLDEESGSETTDQDASEPRGNADE